MSTNPRCAIFSSATTTTTPPPQTIPASLKICVLISLFCVTSTCLFLESPAWCYLTASQRLYFIQWNNTRSKYSSDAWGLNIALPGRSWLSTVSIYSDQNDIFRWVYSDTWFPFASHAASNRPLSSIRKKDSVSPRTKLYNDGGVLVLQDCISGGTIWFSHFCCLVVFWDAKDHMANAN